MGEMVSDLSYPMSGRHGQENRGTTPVFCAMVCKDRASDPVEKCPDPSDLNR